MADKQFSAEWRDGEYMSGWATDPEMSDLGIANFVSGWGTQIPNSIAQALSNDTAAEQPQSGDAIEFGIEDVQRVLILIQESNERRETRRAKQQESDPMMRCDCGHTVRRSWVMNASLGTSCVDCYDRMSDEY